MTLFHKRKFSQFTLSHLGLIFQVGHLWNSSKHNHYIIATAHLELSRAQALERVVDDVAATVVVGAHAHKRPDGGVHAARRRAHVHDRQVEVVAAGQVVLLHARLDLGQHLVRAQVAQEADAAQLGCQFVVFLVEGLGHLRRT